MHACALPTTPPPPTPPLTPAPVPRPVGLVGSDQARADQVLSGVHRASPKRLPGLSRQCVRRPAARRPTAHRPPPTAHRQTLRPGLTAATPAARSRAGTQSRSRGPLSPSQRSAPLRRLRFSIPVESTLGRAWFPDLYQIWYHSELDARGSSSPAKTGCTGSGASPPPPLTTEPRLTRHARPPDQISDAPRRLSPRSRRAGPSK
jgi:hypothetical protein